MGSFATASEAAPAEEQLLILLNVLAGWLAGWLEAGCWLLAAGCWLLACRPPRRLPRGATQCKQVSKGLAWKCLLCRPAERVETLPAAPSTRIRALGPSRAPLWPENTCCWPVESRRRATSGARKTFLGRKCSQAAKLPLGGRRVGADRWATSGRLLRDDLLLPIGLGRPVGGGRSGTKLDCVAGESTSSRNWRRL